ncbi:hypothetical protein [Parasphingorhabdus sp.]|uniref:hypothetical protein n=1 Tax=Parasphingorhabdus sp. TaxID=2709688 RepID=UPI003265C351
MVKQFRIDQGDGEQSFFDGVTIVQLTNEEWFSPDNFDVESQGEFETRKLLLFEILSSASKYKYLAVDFVDFDPTNQSIESGEWFRTVLYGVKSTNSENYAFEGLGYSVIEAQ